MFFINLLLFVTILSSVLILFSNNIVYSLFFLVLTALNVIILFLILGREFIAFIFLIVYVGAICILFLFVIMMLNVQLTERTQTKFNYFPLAIILSIIIIYILISIFYTYKNIDNNYFFNYNPNSILFKYPDSDNFVDFTLTFNNEIRTLSFILYNYYSFSLFISGLILLIAMLGAIILSLDLNKSNIVSCKKQDIFLQLSKDLTIAVRLLKKK